MAAIWCDECITNWAVCETSYLRMGDGGDVRSSGFSIMVDHAANPTFAIKRNMANSVRAVYKKGRNFSVLVNGHTIEVDASKENGGDDTGPSPKVFMLLSLAGCTGFDIVSMLEKMRVSFSDLSISVDGKLSDTEPSIYNKVMITYAIKLDEENKPKMEKAVKLSKDKYCGVSRMFESFADVEFEIKYL